VIPAFDKKYKVVLCYNFDRSHWDRVEWVDKNSNGLVEVKFPDESVARIVYFGFENEDDATFFKIKYGS
jgi:hypothetical protein